jgi:hypothetical protein
MARFESYTPAVPAAPRGDPFQMVDALSQRSAFHQCRKAVPKNWKMGIISLAVSQIS